MKEFWCPSEAPLSPGLSQSFQFVPLSSYCSASLEADTICSCWGAECEVKGKEHNLTQWLFLPGKREDCGRHEKL